MNRPSTFPSFRQGLPGLALSLGLLMGADLPATPPRPADPAAPVKAEFKLLITAANTEQARRALQLDQHAAVKQAVWFFDTPDGMLNANHLILRVRQTGDGPGQSTVKLRAPDGATGLSTTEQAIQPEQDWTQATEPMISRSLDNASLASDLIARVAAGQLPVTGLFNDAQRQLVSARLPGFNWAGLHCYGPVAAQLWHQQWKFQGFPNKVTVELWQLRQDGRTQDLLEVSAKAKAATGAKIQTLANQFYAAAKTAGLGTPNDLTKTQMVLEFFQPGNHGTIHQNQ